MTTATTESPPATQFTNGQIVGIPCSVEDVPFPNEKLVVIDTLDGKMEGLVQEGALRQVGDQWQVRGMVDRTEEDRLVVWVWGEFVHTAGFMDLPLGFAVPA